MAGKYSIPRLHWRVLLLLCAFWRVIAVNTSQSVADLRSDHTPKGRGERVENVRHPRTFLPSGSESQEVEFLKQFRLLPPEQRIELWRRSTNYKYRNTIEYRLPDRIQNLLIIEGTDTAPYLAAILRNKREPYFYRFWAQSILADMERYVPHQSLPKGAKNQLGVDELNLEGALDPFARITGSKIGEEARQALMWAANEAEDQRLRFFVRFNLGLVREEFRALPTEELIRRWRENTRHCGGDGGGPGDFEGIALKDIIVERMPETLGPIVQLLNKDSSSCVRTSTMVLLEATDQYRMRLRKSEPGRSAIEGIRQGLLDGKIKLSCCAAATNEEAWAKVSARFFKDDLGDYPNSPSAFYAEMLNVLYGESTVDVVVGAYVPGTVRPAPAFNGFIAFLTDKDPFFPSWEFTYVGPLRTQTFHPRFQAKMARIEEAWKEFKTGRRQERPSS